MKSCNTQLIRCSILGLFLILAAFSPVISAQEQSIAGFTFYQEYFAPRGYLDPQLERNLNQGMTNGIVIAPPVERGVSRLTDPFAASLMLRLAGSPVPAAITETAIEKESAALADLAETSPNPVLWNLMPEWDQSGGLWVSKGRPRYSGLAREAAGKAFQTFYSTSFPTLIQRLQAPQQARKFKLAAVTDHSPNVFTAYEMGVDLQMLERGIDELGDLSTGIAYLRGAAAQHGKEWGIDLSAWRSTTNMATTYNADGVLQGGWSASYLRRHYYAAFLAGARTILNEAVNYRFANGKLNPLGLVSEEFADFALRRHPDAGQPKINIAILINHTAGFDPKHGVYDQRDAVWYQDIPYSDGDHMTNNFFRLAYPNHWLHGLAPGATFSDSSGVPNQASFRSFLASGGDSRPFEPMPFTRWGDNLDIITDTVPAKALDHYKAIFMLGDVSLNDGLRGDISAWVDRGGILIINAAQTTLADRALLGASVNSAIIKQASSFRWVTQDGYRRQRLYAYLPLLPATAEILAVNEAADPIVTRNIVGAGEVYLTAPRYMQAYDRSQLLDVSIELLDMVFNRFAAARITGAPIEFITGEAEGKILVSLINNSAADWKGEIAVRTPKGFIRVTEYITDQVVDSSIDSHTVLITGAVPAFDVRVYSFESIPPASRPILASSPIRLKRSRQ